MPPLTDDVMLPLLPLHPVGSVILNVIAGAFGAVILVLACVVIPVASVMVTVYVPPESPVIEMVLSPLLQLYYNGNNVLFF